jgi:hypothetical protein
MAQAAAMAQTIRLTSASKAPRIPVALFDEPRHVQEADQLLEVCVGLHNIGVARQRTDDAEAGFADRRSTYNRQVTRSE